MVYRYNYPHHVVDRDVWWYYMIELSFYWALCFSQFYDVKRKDFWEMFIHHITTIALMAFSWTCNLTRYAMKGQVSALQSATLLPIS